MQSNGRNHSLNLTEARAMTPAVNPIEAMRRQLSLAVFDSVKPQDVIDLALKLKERAMAGDIKAAKLYLELVGVMGKQAPPPAESAAGAQIAESLRDLVDEIRIARAEPPRSARKARKALPVANGEGD